MSEATFFGTNLLVCYWIAFKFIWAIACEDYHAKFCQMRANKVFLNRIQLCFDEICSSRSLKVKKKIV